MTAGRTVALADDPDMLDPTLARPLVGRMVFRSMCEKLYDIDQKPNVAPQLALARPADSAVPLRPTARRVLRALRDGGPWYVDRLAAHLSTNSRRPIRPATVATALRELHVTGLAAVDVDDQAELARPVVGAAGRP